MLKRVLWVTAALLAPFALSPAVAAETTLSSDYTMFEGVIRDASGNPAPGVTVELLAWPTASEMNLLREGDEFDLILLDQTVSATDGTYTLSASYNQTPVLGGTAPEVDVDVVAYSSVGQVALFSTTRTVDTVAQMLTVIPELNSTEGGVDNTGAGTTTTTAVRGPASLGTARAKATQDDGLQLLDLTLAQPASPQSSPSNHAPMATCRKGILKQRYNNITTYVGGTYSSVTGTQDLVYTTGRSARLTQGYRAGFDNNNDFSNSTEIARSTTVTTNWAPVTTVGNRVHATRFNYGRYQMCSGTVPSYYQRVKAIGHAGGTETFTASAISATYCVPLEKGSSTSVQSSRAVTWTAGIKLGHTNVGVNLKSNAGFSNGIKNTAKAPSNAARAFCGSKGFPGGAPGQLMLRPRSAAP